MRLLSVKSLQSQLALLKKSKKVSSTKRASPLAPTSVRKGTEMSVESAKRDILRENAQLLRLNKSKQGGLGEILDSAEKNLLRAEAAEVRMRRQAKLQGGDQKTIKDVFRHLSPRDQRLFQLRTREFELALHQAERSIATSENAVRGIADTPLPGVGAAAARASSAARMQSMADVPPAMRLAGPAAGKPAAPSWTTAMSETIGNLVKDGSGAAWGLKPRHEAKAKATAARTTAAGGLPGVLMDNWNMDKGALAARPKGDFAKLPGVKAFGW